MKHFYFSKRSETNLQGVAPLLRAIARRALYLSEVDFVITEGLRTMQRQKELVRQGKSKTFNSKHLPQVDGYGYAIDLAAYDEYGQITWELAYYKRIAIAFEKAANELGGQVTWGGTWKTFIDSPHFQLDYPVARNSEEAIDFAERAKRNSDLSDSDDFESELELSKEHAKKRDLPHRKHLLEIFIDFIKWFVELVVKHRRR